MNNNKINNRLIDKINFRNSNYTDPYQPMNLFNSLVQLSSGIYTEEERFIYELLQNADDAATGSKLKVRIDIESKHFIFSHDGEPFDDIDVESICSVGDGVKSNDENKTGYKGIGFKSVFSHSKTIAIKTGDYFFKFSEENWNDHWQSNWGSKTDWQKERTEKRKSPGVKMPWQIIPIPIEIDGLGINYDVISEFNVSTILFDIKSDNLTQRVLELLQDSQILLFLRSKEVILEVFISGKLILSIKKFILEDTVGLFNDNNLKSEWIVSSKNISIPEDVIDDISKDEKTPPKLKGANTCEISFAVQKEKKKLVSTEEALIYAYLPTSISCGLPFVVNSNFITDASRQQLQKESKWNLWLFNQMAYSYFEWVAELAKAGKLDKSFLTIIPDKLYFGELGSEFNKGFDKALSEIAFIPSTSGKMLRVNEAVYDKTKIAELVSSDVLLKYLNEKYSTTFNSDSFIPEYSNSKKLKNLGVRIFGLEELDDFFGSEVFRSNHSLEDNFKLISFLFDYVKELKNSIEKQEWEEKLKSTLFIFDQNVRLQKPELIYFPTLEYSNEFSGEISFIHEDILEELNKKSNILFWLESLGVKKPSDLNFIKKTIIGDNEFITNDNAIEVGRYLFNAHKKGIIEDQFYSELKEINLLTQMNTLIRANDCFLSDFFEPELKLEKVYDNDFYTSELYLSSYDLKSEWKSFFLKIGVKENIECGWQEISFDSKGEWSSRFDKDFLGKVFETSKKYSWKSYEGWSTKNDGYGFYPDCISFYGLSFLQYTTEYHFSKLFFNNVFNKFSPYSIEIDKEISVIGYTGFFRRGLYSGELKSQNCPTNYFRWILDNLEIFPTITGELFTARNVILNSIENIKIGGKYLPIIDVDTEISDEWLNIIPLQRYLSFDDYLKILVSISCDLENVEENKDRVLAIYKVLSSNYLSKKKELSEWGKVNKLLNLKSEFILATELKYVTEKGFESEDILFADADDDSPNMMKLFELFGVTVIHEFKPEIINPHFNPSLKIRLQEILPYILLIAEKRNSINYSESYTNLSEIIENYQFVDADEIFLSYENNEELVLGNTVRSYLSKSSLYYKNKWSNPLTLYSLVPDISKLLLLKNLNEELKVILLSDFEDIRLFLTELGINVTEAVSRAEFIESVQKTKDYTTDEDEIEPSVALLDYSDERSRINISNEAKHKIFEELRAKGFIIPPTLNINYTVVKGIRNPQGNPITLVVKSGKKGSLYFNPGEWLVLSDSDVQLFVVSRGNIVRNTTMEDLLEYNETFHMRFNTQVFSVNTNLKAFAKFFHYLKYTHFIFNTPENTNDYFLEFGLNERNKSASDLTPDDKNLLL